MSFSHSMWETKFRRKLITLTVMGMAALVILHIIFIYSSLACDVTSCAVMSQCGVTRSAHGPNFSSTIACG